MARPTLIRGHRPLAAARCGTGSWTLVAGSPVHERTAAISTRRPRGSQLELVLKAFGKDGVGGLPPTPGRGKDESYLCHPERVMVRSQDVPRLESFFNERRDTYRGGGRVSGELVGDLLTYELPARVEEGRPDVHLTLGEIDEVLGEGLVRPDHIVHVAVRGTGKMCPATEPELPLGKRPAARPQQERRRRQGRPGLGRRHRLVRRGGDEPREPVARPGGTSRATSRP